MKFVVEDEETFFHISLSCVHVCVFVCVCVIDYCNKYV